MALVVRYSTGATLSYHLTAYSPWEGYRVAFNGTRVASSSKPWNVHLQARAPHQEAPRTTRARILVRPHWGPPEVVVLDKAENEGGHAGADMRLLEHLFGNEAGEDPLSRGASYRDGVYAILPGIGANRSFETGQPVDLTGLLEL